MAEAESKMPFAPKGIMPAIADDQMVMQHNAKRGRGLADLSRHFHIRTGRRWIARRVVMYQD
jgi:hypothetical protein